MLLGGIFSVERTVCRVYLLIRGSVSFLTSKVASDIGSVVYSQDSTLMSSLNLLRRTIYGHEKKRSIFR